MLDGEKPDSEFRMRGLKYMLIDNYGESVTIATNKRLCESDIVFSSSITPADLVLMLSNMNIVKVAAVQLQTALREIDFGLNDSFRDGADLKQSWENAITPSSLITSFSALFNVSKYKLFTSPVINLNEA